MRKRLGGLTVFIVVVGAVALAVAAGVVLDRSVLPLITASSQAPADATLEFGLMAEARKVIARGMREVLAA